jgi:peptidoglycan L-alanyl-D-glutamate endopeptidase CwlK
MAFSLSNLSSDRLQGVHPDLVRGVERAIRITTQDFRVQEGLRTRERQAELVARGASRTMNSRHLTDHPVDLRGAGRRGPLAVGGLLFLVRAAHDHVEREQQEDNATRDLQRR